MSKVLSLAAGMVVGYGMHFAYRIVLDTIYIGIGISPSPTGLDAISDILGIFTAILIALEMNHRLEK